MELLIPVSCGNRKSMITTVLERLNRCKYRRIAFRTDCDPIGQTTSVGGQGNNDCEDKCKCKCISKIRKAEERMLIL